MNKFNHFAKAQEEISKTNPSATTSSIPPKRNRETKEQMSIMLTPTHKKKLRKLADDSGMSASELIGYWIDQN